jgi:hypothetical protein
VLLDAAHRLLFVVNTESARTNDGGTAAYNQDCNQGTITSFRVASDGTLTWADRVFSGGLYPNSLTVRSSGIGSSTQNAELLYVLNAGGPGKCGTGPNISGFTVNAGGQMQAIGSRAAIYPGPPMQRGA